MVNKFNEEQLDTDKQALQELGISEEDMRILMPYKNILDLIAKFYKKNGEAVYVEFEDADTAYCTEDNKIVIPPSLVLNFVGNNLPKFCVFYHELGHALYSKESFKLISKWKNLSSIYSTHQYSSKYLHLLNWIEDFYIENKLVRNYPYLQDIIKCIGLIPHKYDDTERQYAFHYYYTHKHASPTFNINEQAEFENYIKKLIVLRESSMFGSGPLSLLNPKNVNMNFINTLKNFYNWCVNKQIWPDVCLPPLSLPSNIITYAKNGNDKCSKNNNNDSDKDPFGNGNYSTYDKTVGITVTQVFPVLDSTLTNPIITEQFKAEKNYISKTLNSYRHDTQRTNLYGVFTTDYDESPMIGKPIIPNFFNTHRLEDRILFKQPGKTFNNVSIYRDISGSTYGNIFELIDNVCNYLCKNIPIEKHFYLYSSGNISILETEYQPWNNSNDIPESYLTDPIFNQMNGGTNSGAIAEVMSEQLNDKWLNIIVTDGDLYDLFKRDNIESLLKNIAVIEVSDRSSDSACKNSMGKYQDHYIKISNEEDFYKINDMLNTLKEES